MNWNSELFTLVHQFAGRSRLLDGAGFFLADTLTYFLVVGCIVFALRPRGTRKKLFAAGELLLALLIARGIVVTLVRAIFPYDRPFIALEFEPALLPNVLTAFPSGHMAGLFAISYVVYRYDRRASAEYFILSALVGLGKVFVGVHWPLDILGGIAAGLFGGWAADRLVRRERRMLFPPGDGAAAAAESEGNAPVPRRLKP